jgi:hypothetical protein
MTRILFAALLVVLASAAEAQPFAAVKPGTDAWWLRTSFNPAQGVPLGAAARALILILRCGHKRVYARLRRAMASLEG